MFLSSHAGAEVTPRAGQGRFEAVQIGYRDEIRALLRIVRRVVVIRDTPTDAPGHLRCVASALAAHRSPGRACARLRDSALRPDALAAAAQSFGARSVKLIDLTFLTCDRDRCYPVVGGALVHRDAHHLTPAFSATLGPYILRALNG